MKKTLVTFMFASIVMFSFATDKQDKTDSKAEAVQQVELKGQILDKQTQEALVGVKVELEGTEQVAYTDFEGNYTFKAVKTGNYNISASFISYEKAMAENVQISHSKNQFDFSLKTLN